MRRRPAVMAAMLLGVVLASDRGVGQASELPAAGRPAAERFSAIPPVGDVSTVTPAQQAMYDGMLAAQDGRYADAAPRLEAALAAEPTLIGAWQTLGWCYWHLGRPDETQALWERLRALNPKLPQVYEWLGQIATIRGDFAAAIRLYDQALELDPDGFDLRFDRARLLLWRGQLSDAVQTFRALLDTDPDRFDVMLELARALQIVWRYEDALPLWQQLRELAPGVAEYELGVALSLLHTGRRPEAIALAEAVLEQDPRSAGALRLLADAAEYGPRPAQAVPYFRRAIDASEDAGERKALLRRLSTLLIRLHLRQPLLHPIDSAVDVTRERLRDDAMDIDAWLILGELLLMERRWADSESAFYYVLRSFNPNNLRAHRGLLEIALARFQFEQAREHLDRIRAFNPRDPYLLVDEAMYHARRGDFTAAHRLVDALERRGGQGAAAVLRYSVVTPSEVGPAMPVSRLREHWQALRDAGYRFLTADELPEYFAMVSQLPETVAGVAPGRAVVITFDGALEPAMSLAGQVAGDMGLVLTQFVPVGTVEEADALVATWEALTRYQHSGRWRFGSLLYKAHATARVFLADAPQAPLANRLHRADDDRLETTDEFIERVRSEYARSQALLRERIGREVAACAYPEGDIGQLGTANEAEAIGVNLAQAERFYRMGFIARVQGHAVNGDHPFLYGRYEPPPWMTGEALVRHLQSQHPVFLAQRLRLEFAAFEGRRQLARETLARMERSGYPAAEIRRLEQFIQERLARKFDVPSVEDDPRATPWDMRLEQPWLGVSARFFSDALDSESVRGTVSGGLNLTPHWTVEAYVGGGRHSQPEVPTNFVDGAVDGRPDIEINETVVGLRSAFVLPRRTVLTVAAGQRRFSGDVEASIPTYGLALNIRPVDPLDLKLEFEHDALAGARAMRRELTHDLLGAQAVWSLTDRWDVWGSARHYALSDGNRRTHWHILPMALLWPEPGWILGLRYAEDDSRDEDFDYWTPNRQQGLYIETGFRGNWRRHYYSLVGRVGRARERIRPETLQAHADLVALYEELLDRARRGRWGRRAIIELEEALIEARSRPPASNWETVVGIQASWTLRWSRHWEVECLFAYEETPRYDETHVGAGIRYRF